MSSLDDGGHSQGSCLQQPCYHSHPTPATGAPCPSPGLGATGLQHPLFMESQRQPRDRNTSPAQFPHALSPVGPSLMGTVGASHQPKRAWVLAPAPAAPLLSQHLALPIPTGRILLPVLV